MREQARAVTVDYPKPAANWDAVDVDTVIRTALACMPALVAELGDAETAPARVSVYTNGPGVLRVVREGIHWVAIVHAPTGFAFPMHALAEWGAMFGGYVNVSIYGAAYLSGQVTTPVE